MQVEPVELHVSGMSCRAGEQRIERALARAEGVLRNAADHQAGQVPVVFDRARTSQEAVRSCIEQAGYGVSP